MEILGLRTVIVLCFVFGPTFEASSNLKDEFSLTIRMPDVVSDRPDDLICTGFQLDPAESYLIRFHPLASKDVAHHLMVYGCKVPGSYEPSWQCHEYEKVTDESVCGDKSMVVLYAWANDGPGKDLPEGVGFRVSGETDIKYLIVQLHYASKFPKGVTDNSGITLDLTRKRPEQLANYLVLGAWGTIPPQKKAYYIETSCVYEKNFTIYPIGYRTHSHNLGYVTSGYRIRDGIWTEIGRMSPQLPQTFYPVSHPGMDIRNGDVLVARCTMNSMARKEDTIIGTTNHDEMCNFYIMYSTFNPEQQKTDYCFQDTSSYRWALDEKIDLTNIPKDVSSLAGIPGAQEVEAIFSKNSTSSGHSHGR